MWIKPKRSFKRRLFSGSGWALFTMLVWEIVESTLEYAVAYVISGTLAMLITKALTTLAILTTTQIIKVSLQRFFMVFIKKLTYKQGDDKVKMLKKIGVWIVANKKTITATVMNAATAGSGAAVSLSTDVLPEILLSSGFNLGPIIYCVVFAVVFILTEIGILGKGKESIVEYQERKAEEKALKEEKALEKEAIKELEAEENEATKTIAEEEKAKQEAEAKAKADEEKAKQEAEHRAKIEEIKAKIKAEKQANENK